jgi:hypothetical protein
VKQRNLTQDFEHSLKQLKDADEKAWLDICFSTDAYYTERVVNKLRERIPEEKLSVKQFKNNGRFVYLAECGDYEGDGLTISAALNRLLRDVVRRG